MLLSSGASRFKEKLPDFVGYGTFGVIPAESLPGQPAFFIPKGRPMDARGAGFVGAAKADRRFCYDDAGPGGFRPSRLEGRCDGLSIMPIDFLDLPAIALKTSGRILATGEFHAAFDCDGIIVI